MSIRSCLSLGVLVVAVFGGQAAVCRSANAADAGPSDADKAQARKHFDQGRRLFDLRHYMESVLEFESAYRLSGDPAFLYNIAQAYRLADRPEEAIHYYNTFLKRAPNTSSRAEVERRLNELQSAKSPPNQVTEPAGKTVDPTPSGDHSEQLPPPTAAPLGWGARPNAPESTSSPEPVKIPDPPPSERLSRGFFGQAEFGLGLVSAHSSDADVGFSAFGGLLTLRAGAFVRPQLGVFGQLSSAAGRDPTVSASGRSVTVPGSLSYTGFGGGAIYYFPSKWFGSASLLIQDLNWDGGMQVVSDSLGAALSLSAGREWAFNDRWSGGVVGQLHAGGIGEGDNGTGAWSTFALCAGVVVTYN
jgi:hypothetical protein